MFCQPLSGLRTLRFVLYARVRRQGVTPKLMSTWTGPWRVVGADHSHVFSVQNIVSGEVHIAHVARVRFCADADLNITTAEIKDCLLYTSPSPRD